MAGRQPQRSSNYDEELQYGWTGSSGWRTSQDETEEINPLLDSQPESVTIQIDDNLGNREIAFEPVYTQSIEEDIEVLKGQGFIINYPDGKLGGGVSGEVYSGIYGQNAAHCRDAQGNPIDNVGAGLPFACKLVDFNEDDPLLTLLPYDVSKRDSYEIEKYILTFADHRNITPIRMAINMGKTQIHTNARTGDEYFQSDRIYLIMDLADYGSLLTFLPQYSGKLTSVERVKLIQDCFKGMKYLHDEGIVHGDIHLGNVLVFGEQTGYVAKWVDFGGGYVSSKIDLATPELPDWTLINKKRFDCIRLSSILKDIWAERRRDDEPQHIQQIFDRFRQLIDDIKRIRDLNQVYLNYQSLVDWNQSDSNLIAL